MIRRVLALVACALVLASCRLDVAVDMTVEADGTGTINVVVTADADVVAAVPTIADELATDDIVAAGWTVGEPTATDTGGLTLTLTHPFASAQEATNLLNSLGPPFNDMALSRGTAGDDTTNRLTGVLRLIDGFESFADADLVAAVGAVPFADQLAASGATPESALGATLRARLPGAVDSGTSNGERLSTNERSWTAPVDGSVLEVHMESTQSPGDDRWWARPLSVVALVALIGWVLFMVAFIGYVAFARWQRARRRATRRSARHADPHTDPARRPREHDR